MSVSKSVNFKKVASSLAGASKSLSGKLKLIAGILVIVFVVIAAFQPQADLPSSPPASQSETIPSTSPNQLYPVDRVVDGDTVRVLINQQSTAVRLIGVNTPEAVDPRRPVQCFGQEASKYTKQLLEGQSVYLRADPTQDDHDQYDRLLRYVILNDGTNVNQHLVANGFAYEYTYQVPYQMQEQFEQAELQARQEQRGLWHPSACGQGGGS